MPRSRFPCGIMHHRAHRLAPAGPGAQTCDERSYARLSEASEDRANGQHKHNNGDDHSDRIEQEAKGLVL